MTREQKIVLKDSMHWIEYAIKNNKSMIFIGYNDEDKQFMSYSGDSENLLNLAARIAAHFCKICKYSVDDFMGGVRKYMESTEAKNEVRD